MRNTIPGKDVLTQIGTKVCVSQDKHTKTYRLRFDINDVSSKHDSKKFVICLYVDGPGHLGLKFAPCFTKGIKVYSRKAKFQRKSPEEEEEEEVLVRIPKPGIDDNIGENAKREITSDDSAKNVMIWARLARESLEILQWSRFAALMDDARHGNANMGWPLFRCPSCFAYRDNVRGAQKHHQNCSLATMLDLYVISVTMKKKSLEKHHSNAGTEISFNKQWRYLRIEMLSLYPCNRLNQRK